MAISLSNSRLGYGARSQLGASSTEAALLSIDARLKDLDPDKRIRAISPTELPSPLPAANKGEYFYFNTSGSIVLNTVERVVNQGDWLWCNADGTAEGEVGNWELIALPDGKSPYWAAPVIDKITPSDLPSVGNAVEGDRYLINSPIAIKELKGGAWIDEEFPSGASVTARGFATYQRQGNDLICLLASIARDRVPTPCDNFYHLGSEWTYDGKTYKAIANILIGSATETLGNLSNTGTLVGVNQGNQSWQSFTPPNTGGMRLQIGGYFDPSSKVRAIFRLYEGVGTGGELLYAETVSLSTGFSPELLLSCQPGVEAGKRYTWSLEKPTAADANFVLRSNSNHLPLEQSNRGEIDYQFRVTIAPTDGITWLELKPPSLAPTYTQRFSGLLPKIKSGDSTKWVIEAGSGQFVDLVSTPLNPTVSRFTYRETELNIPSILDGTQTSCYGYLYDNSGVIAVGIQKDAPVADDLIDKLFIGAIISTDGTNISAIYPISLADEPETKSLLNFGAINVTQSFPVPRTLMRLRFPASTFKFPGRNAYNNPKYPHTLSFPELSSIYYTLVAPTGAVIAPNRLIFEFNRYWDIDTAQVVSLSNTSYFAVQFLYRFPSGAFATVLGIEEYSHLDLARSGWREIETQRRPPNFRNATKFIATIIGQGSATGDDISDRNKVLILPNYE